MWVQWLCAVLAIIGYVLFIEDYGVWAAAAVLSFVYLLRLVLFYFYSQYVLHLPYQHKTWLLTLILGSFALGAFYLGLQPLLSDPLATMNLILGLVVGAGLSVMYLGALIFYKVLPNPLMLWQQRQANVVTL